MGDINLLPTDDHASGERDASSKGIQDEDLALHVPTPEPPEKPISPAGASLLSQLIAKDGAESLSPEKLFSQKIEPIPPSPPAPALQSHETASVRKPVPTPFPPKTAPPRLPTPPLPPVIAVKPRAPASQEKGSDTLRVSLITGNGGAGLSNLALQRRQRIFMMIGVLGLLIDGLIFGGLHLQKLSVEKRNFEAIQAVQNIDAKIATREIAVADVRDFQALSKAAARVLDGHAHWTEVLKLLEQRALPEVQFGSLAGAETGTLGFEITARDYTTLAKQIVAFRQDTRVKKVTVGTATADLGENQLLKGVRASMTLIVDPEIFRYKPQTAAALP